MIRISTVARAPGWFYERVYIAADDSAVPVTAVAVMGRIKAEFTMSKAELDLGDVSSDSRATAEMEIVIDGPSHLAILRVESTDPRLRVGLLNVDSRARRFRLTVRQVPRAPRGLYIGGVVVSTNSEYKPRLYVAVRGRVV
jgi:hypothetical protein